MLPSNSDALELRLDFVPDALGDLIADYLGVDVLVVRVGHVVPPIEMVFQCVAHFAFCFFRAVRFQSDTVQCSFEYREGRLHEFFIQI